MYTELVKIIEGGLKKDTVKVASYARVLADNLAKSGDVKLSEKILKLINEVKAQPVFMDQLIASPVDNETRQSLVDVYMPVSNSVDLVVSESVRTSIEEFVTSISHKNELKAAGLDANMALLLYGPPGCGKTSIAKYISNTLNMPLVIARFDSLVSSLLGSTSKNIRKVFEFANSKPCILFLDEFDAIAKARDDKHELGELKRVINSLLQNIDDFTNDNILLAATNHPELLDKAVWRRFNHLLEVKEPSKQEIESLLSIYLKNFDSDFLNDSKKVDKLISHFQFQTPANIRATINAVLTKAIIDKKSQITYEDLLLEIFKSKHRGAYTQEDLIGFLTANGVSQNAIAELFRVSLRQVRNAIKHK